MKLLFTIIMVLTMSNIFAVYIPPPQPAIEQHNGGCLPPINFSIEHKCSLSYSSIYAVNTYNCGQYQITGDCNGGVVNSNDGSESLLSQGILLGIVFLGIGIFIKFSFGW